MIIFNKSLNITCNDYISLVVVPTEDLEVPGLIPGLICIIIINLSEEVILIELLMFWVNIITVHSETLVTKA